MTMITVQLLGGASLRSGDSPLTGPPAQRHRIALLALIVAAWPQSLSRDRAMALLWPERDLAGARRLLNLAVHVLRSALGDGAITSTGDGLLLNPSRLSCDLHELRSAIAADASDRIVRLYAGPLLDGFHLDDSTEFGYWLDERRSEIDHAYVGALLALAERQEQTEDVIAHLSKIRALKVTSRTAVMQFKQRQHSLKEIGTALGATTLLDGTIRHVGDRVRIVAKLIDVETDKNLWAETYDRQLTDIFSIQTDVALQIAAALKAELSPDEDTRVRKEPTSDIQAYKLHLKGRHWCTKSTIEAYPQAIDYFDRAIARDPTFARAWASLATAYTELAEGGVAAPDVSFARAAEAAATALRLDPDLAAAHCATAHIKMVREFDWAGAEREFKRALELSPSDDDTYDLYWRLCASLGRNDEAIALQRRAQELDPNAHRMDMVTALLRAGRYVEAEVEAKDAADLEPGYDRARATLGWAYFLGGKKEEGLAELEEEVAISPGNTMWLGQLGGAYALAGNTTKARGILWKLEERARVRFVSPCHIRD